MAPSFDRDPLCQHLGQYLMAGLNALDTRQVVAAVSTCDRLAIATGMEFPLLQVLRGPCTGRSLEFCELRIEYFLLNPQAYYEQPNTLRVVETAIAELLETYHQTGENACVQLDLDTLKSSGPLYMRFGSNGENIFPYIRIQFKCTDMER